MMITSKYRSNKWLLALFYLTVVGCLDATAATINLVSSTILPNTSSVTYGGLGVTDFRIFQLGVTKSGGPGSISTASTDGTLQDGNSPNFFVNWSDGVPTSSGSTNHYTFVGTGSGFSPRATFEQFSLTMVNTNQMLKVLMFGNANTGSQSYRVSLGDFQQSFALLSGSSWQYNELLFNISAANPGDVLNFRIDSVTGTNNFNNVGLVAAQTSIPEPSSITLFSIGAVFAFRWKGRPTVTR
jgi:hypothetical protein